MFQPPYAPMPHSYVPDTARSATINLDEVEVKLSSTRAESDMLESLGEIFSILITLDALEKAFVKDVVPEAEYTEICERLLKQYKSLLADEAVAAQFVSIEEFKAQWDLEVPRATERIRVGMPATTISASFAAPSTSAAATAFASANGVLIAEATQEFITFLDAAKLGLLSKDQLHPLLSDVIQSVNRVTDKDFEHRGKIVQWLITLNQMKATDELDEGQARELEMDIQQAYNGFKRILA
ncbi:hypothetical protein TD95_000067 [Thielaviopsis punctulata]|uniref:Vacuolar protein sorting-associated protein 28 n=1 Tax=Thielaviopsis punctulata TaxID=72032 RepID=A0A0F4Z838_9PEZI|nr:hypothetical protein TD95_000067 [Thielaviopsis punctulata]